jgi:hypothetical protein
MGLGAHTQFRPCWRVSTDRPRHAVAAQGPEDVGGPPNSAPVLSGPRRSQGRSSGHGRSGVRPAFREPGGRVRLGRLLGGRGQGLRSSST